MGLISFTENRILWFRWWWDVAGIMPNFVSNTYFWRKKMICQTITNGVICLIKNKTAYREIIWHYNLFVLSFKPCTGKVFVFIERNFMHVNISKISYWSFPFCKIKTNIYLLPVLTLVVKIVSCEISTSGHECANGPWRSSTWTNVM